MAHSEAEILHGKIHDQAYRGEEIIRFSLQGAKLSYLQHSIVTLISSVINKVNYDYYSLPFSIQTMKANTQLTIIYVTPLS